MMTIQNLDPKENLEVKSKGRMYAEMCLKLSIESGCYFCILPSQDGFERDCLESKFQKITS